jgi:iron(III) transport system permease protein
VVLRPVPGHTPFSVRQPSTGLLLFWVICLTVGILVVLPIGYVLYTALQSGDPVMDEQRHWTLQNLVQVFTNSRYLRALWNTVSLAAVVATSATVVGSLLAWAVARTDMPGRRWLETAIMIPIFLSPFTGALAWMFLGSPRTGYLNVLAVKLFGLDHPPINIMSAGGVIWSMFLFFVPQAFLLTIGALRTMDPALEEASTMVGGSPWKTLVAVTLPVIRPSLLSAFFLVFVLATEMFSIPGLLGAPGGYLNLPFVIYSDVKFYPPRFPQGAAASAMLLLLMAVSLCLYQYSVRNASRYVTVSARGYRKGTFKVGWVRYLLMGSCLVYFALAVVVPYATLTVVSFLRFVSPNLRLELFTLEHFRAILTGTEILRAICNTLLVAVVGATGAVLLGMLVAFLTTRLKPKGASIMDYVAMFPIALPGVLIGIGISITYLKIPIGIYNTLWILLLAYVTVNMPQAVRVASGALLQIDRSLEESSRVVGATDLQTLRYISTPLLRPALIAVWMLTLVAIIREVSASVILAGTKSTVISVVMWNSIENGSFGEAAALGLFQTVLILVILAIARRVAALDERILKRLELVHEGGLGR